VRRIRLTESHFLAIDLVDQVLQLAARGLEGRPSFNLRSLDFLRQQRAGKANNYLKVMTVVAQLAEGSLEVHLDCTLVDDFNDFQAFAPASREPLPVYVREVAIKARLSWTDASKSLGIRCNAKRIDGQLRIEQMAFT
jgi:hypothetical protein